MNINNKSLCVSCFADMNTAANCPVCGNNQAAESKYTTALPAGTILLGRYIIGKVLGKGGFGITYLAYDTVEDKKAAVKEYLPDSLAHRNAGDTTVSTTAEDKEDAFRKGAEKFYEEAQILSRFNGNPGLIWVYKFFYENNTAYFVMEYLEGCDLKSHIVSNGAPLNERQLLDIIIPLIDSLIVVHSIGVLHRDISPDNIYITSEGKIKLIDFGAARQVLGEVSKSLSVILKQGFAPIEQYQTRGKQGPWTDIYALGATMYYCLTGSIPDAPMDRLDEDNLTMPSGISGGLSYVLQKMMAVRAANRYQNMPELKNDMVLQGLFGAEAVAMQTYAPPPVESAQSAQVAESPTKSFNKKNKAIYALITAAVVIIAGLSVFLVTRGGNLGDNIPVTADYDYTAQTPPERPATTPPPETTPPPVTTPPPATTPPPEPPTPEPAPTPATPTHTRMGTLGDFMIHNNDAPDTQKGWLTDNYADDIYSPFESIDFKMAPYLILEFWNPPAGGVWLCWNSELSDWNEYQFVAVGGSNETVFVIDMGEIPHYHDTFLASLEIRLLLGYYSDSWDDLQLKDAYFADLI
ncbi:MAG: serine/threonine protein kinase [Oscillospiraceae bacterium]|nr:serine/threonine protein kinase [Oscillospiraceae bacterium]